MKWMLRARCAAAAVVALMSTMVASTPSGTLEYGADYETLGLPMQPSMHASTILSGASSCFTTLDVSQACGLGLLTLLAKKDAIKQAYTNYAYANALCLDIGIHNGACWDKRLQRLGQGTCNVKDCHSREDLIKNATGISRLCNATATVGTDGAVIEALVPLPIPNPCRNPSDLTALKKCVVNQTCGNFSSEVVPVCDIDLGCNGMPHDESYKTDFAAVVGTVFATVVALSLLAAIGTHLSRAKAKRGLSHCVRLHQSRCRSGLVPRRKTILCTQQRSQGTHRLPYERLRTRLGSSKGRHSRMAQLVF